MPPRWGRKAVHVADLNDFATAVGGLMKGVREAIARPAQVTVSDINNLTAPGWHQATQAGNVSIPNTPAPGDRMTYEVIAGTDVAIITQIARSQVTPRSWWRVRQASGTWSGWYGGYDAMQTLGTTDMNTLTGTGTYLLVNGAALAASSNLGTPNRQIIRVQTALLPYTTQEVVDLTTGRTFSRAYNNGIWSPWNATATLADITEPAPAQVGIDSAGAALTNALLVEDWSRRRGGRKRIATGAVALRFDHGLANFNSKLRPLLEARNLPYSLALNAGNWANAENTGVTKEMVNSWVQGGLCEIWNHSLTHNSTSSEATWRNEIVGGLNQLRTDLPAAQIDGWAVPSLQGIGYVHPDGTYLMGSTVEEYYNTPAGRLILATHAVATGYIPNTYQRVLDGVPRQSQLHWTFDKSTLAQIQGFIATTESQKRGLQLMLHPSLVDTADHITTATVTAILDHIVAERDAGRLTVLGPYDLMLADAT